MIFIIQDDHCPLNETSTCAQKALHILSVALSAQIVKRVRLGNTTRNYRSQHGVISDSPITPFEGVGEVSRFSIFNFG